MESKMASLYKNNNTWYLSITHNGIRKARSLKTKCHQVAKTIKPHAESTLIAEINGYITKNENLSFDELCKRFLVHNHSWSINTYKLIKHILTSHLSGKPLPANPTSKAIHIRHINQCWKWGVKNNLVQKAKLLPGDTKGESRLRTFTKEELQLMFSCITNKKFNQFVQFAYYTGARSGEIRSLAKENVLDDSIIVRGKTGRRIVKLNNQAKKVIRAQDELWNYTKDYVSHRFKKEVRRLGIKNARFHDLRRTFGLNLIKQGMSVYKVSKLLGHKSVRTTEQHYAPLLTIEIEDFVL